MHCVHEHELHARSAGSMHVMHAQVGFNTALQLARASAAAKSEGAEKLEVRESGKRGPSKDS